jgi:hypothetical protein
MGELLAAGWREGVPGWRERRKRKGTTEAVAVAIREARASHSAATSTNTETPLRAPAADTADIEGGSPRSAASSVLSSGRYETDPNLNPIHDPTPYP